MLRIHFSLKGGLNVSFWYLALVVKPIWIPVDFQAFALKMRI